MSCLFKVFILSCGLALVVITLPRLKADIDCFLFGTKTGNQMIRHSFSKKKSNHLIKRVDTTIENDFASGPLHEEGSFNIEQNKSGFSNVQSWTSGDLIQAENVVDQAIELSPAEPYLWFKKAALMDLQQQTPARIVQALSMSIQTGANEPGLIMKRLLLSLKWMPHFRGKRRMLLVSQVKLAWAYSPEEFLSIIARNKTNRIFLFLLLKDLHPTLLTNMVAAFEKTT